MIRFAHVLCPTDFSEFSLHAFDHAVALAQRGGARVTLLHVFLNRPVLDVPPIMLAAADREQILADLRRVASRAAGRVHVECEVVEAASVVQEILCQARRGAADLLVLGSHGRSGFDRFLLGSVTERVLRRAPCPVLVVPRRAADADVSEPVHIRRVLYPTDFSSGAQHALGYSRWIATEPDARLTLLHVIEVPPELRVREFSGEPDVARLHAEAEAEALSRLRTLVPLETLRTGAAETCVREGAAYREILAVAAERQADVIVMGIQGRNALDLAVFGSNAARLTRGAACPVLIVPPH